MVKIEIPSDDDCQSEVDMDDINSEVSIPLECNVIALQGSSTYLLKYLKLDNVVVTVGMIIAEIESTLCELQVETDIDGIMLNNLLYAKFMFERLLKLDSNTLVIAKREFVDSDGNTLSTQLPAGYVSENDTCKTITNDFMVIDCGTGELKPFTVSSIDGKSYKSVVASDKHDSTTFYENIKNVLSLSSAFDVSSEIESLKTIFTEICPNIEEMKTICIGTQKFRELVDEYNLEDIIRLFKQIHNNLEFRLLKPDEESMYEFSAIANAFTNGVQPQFHSSLSSDAPNVVFKLVGNIAWGNGSGQGIIYSTKFDIDVGLKTILVNASSIFDSSIIISDKSDESDESDESNEPKKTVINIKDKKYENITPEVFDIIIKNVNDYLDTKISE